MKNIVLIFIVFLLSSLGCKKMQDNFLNKKPFTVLLENQVWSNPTLINSVLADLYDRIPSLYSFQSPFFFGTFDEGFNSQNSEYGKYRGQNWAFNEWNIWDYGYIRDINLFIDNAEKAEIDEGQKNNFLVQARFIRAMTYFEFVKRMGGVPLVLDTLQYNFDGDVSHLRVPRSSEKEVYDFVLNELSSIQDLLPNDPGIHSTATWGAAMAMKSRVALYAASIAKYGASTPSVSLSNDIIGIPAQYANEYYKTAFDAADSIVKSGKYSLYKKHPENLSENFAQLFLDKNSNPEVIFVKDYLSGLKSTQYTPNNQPHSMALAGENVGVLNPSLNLAQSFETLDNEIKPFESKDNQGNFISYDNISDIFKNRDYRLSGTIILPGSKFRDIDLDIWSGYVLPQDSWSEFTGSNFGQLRILPGTNDPIQIVGRDGPIPGLQYGTQTGFYVRKYLNPDPLAGNRTNGSDTWWIYYRYGEVLLNAAEAAYELNDPQKAADFLNELRERAGLVIPLEASDIDFNRIAHERKVELAFEGHELFDLKRWRIAHKVWNGVRSDLTSEPGKAEEPSSRIYGLYPYKIFAPGDPNDGKWIFKEKIPQPFSGVYNFRLGNYYSQVPQDALSNNPLLVPNPNQ